MIPRGSVALVTGAARRIGRAVALRLARGGCRVAVHCRDSRREGAEVVRAVRAAGGEARLFAADLSRPKAVERLVRSVERSLGPVSVLVNNASVFRATPFLRSTPADLEDHLAVNLRAPWLLCRAVAPGMVERGAGKIVNLGDIHAERPLADHPAYAASKAALHALTLALARDLAPAVQVNAVAPGAVLLPEGAPASRARALARLIPAGRLGTPEEVAEAVAFLVEGPDFVTGEILRVDGGRHCRG
ncbi:MAG: SDR family oxidoreductase [Planctomycetes bacterium]|nr:SDR family oxidoreductase [Planctomycetota bacterium]